MTISGTKMFKKEPGTGNLFFKRYHGSYVSECDREFFLECDPTDFPVRYLADLPLTSLRRKSGRYGHHSKC
jgi:hypothetical protein